jgi:hypothetical protein
MTASVLISFINAETRSRYQKMVAYDVGILVFIGLNKAAEYLKLDDRKP